MEMCVPRVLTLTPRNLFLADPKWSRVLKIVLGRLKYTSGSLVDRAQDEDPKLIHKQ